MSTGLVQLFLTKNDLEQRSQTPDRHAQAHICSECRLQGKSVDVEIMANTDLYRRNGDPEGDPFWRRESHVHLLFHDRNKYHLYFHQEAGKSQSLTLFSLSLVNKT